MKNLSKTLAIALIATTVMAAAPLSQAEARPHDHHGWRGHHGGGHHGHRGHGNWHRGNDRGNHYGAAFGLGALTGALLNRPYYYGPPRYHAPRPVYYGPTYYAYPSRTVVIYR